MILPHGIFGIFTPLKFKIYLLFVIIFSHYLLVKLTTSISIFSLTHIICLTFSQNNVFRQKYVQDRGSSSFGLSLKFGPHTSDFVD